LERGIRHGVSMSKGKKLKRERKINCGRGLRSEAL